MPIASGNGKISEKPIVSKRTKFNVFFFSFFHYWASEVFWGREFFKYFFPLTYFLQVLLHLQTCFFFLLVLNLNSLTKIAHDLARAGTLGWAIVNSLSTGTCCNIGVWYEIIFMFTLLSAKSEILLHLKIVNNIHEINISTQ